MKTPIIKTSPQTQIIRSAWLQCLAGYRHKTRIALALDSLLSCSTAFAADGWSYTLEPEFESVEGNGASSDYNAASLTGILGYRQGMNKFDFKLETSKDYDTAAATGGKVEARYRRYFEKLAGIEPSLRVSLGENFKSGADDFLFFTVEPKLAYEMKGGWEPYVSMRYRNAFESSKNYRTETFYFGVAFNVGHGWEIESSISRKIDDERSVGIKLEITKSFQPTVARWTKPTCVLSCFSPSYSHLMSLTNEINSNILSKKKAKPLKSIIIQVLKQESGIVRILIQENL